MKCPVCVSTALSLAERQGIEIDYCPQCRGVWLDRGELDKLIERSLAGATPSSAPARPVHAAPDAQVFGHRPAPYRQGGSEHRDHDAYKRKKKGFLGDIFDFD